jgi:hypothetical protein
MPVRIPAWQPERLRHAPRLSSRTAPQWKPAPKAANTTGRAVIAWSAKYSAAAIGIEAEEVFPQRSILQ